MICVIALAILGFAFVGASIWLIAPGSTYAWTSTGWTWAVPLNSLPISTMISSALLGTAGAVSIGSSIYLNMKREAV